MSHDVNETNLIRKRKQDSTQSDSITRNESSGIHTISLSDALALYRRPSPTDQSIPASFSEYFSPLLARFVDGFSPDTDALNRPRINACGALNDHFSYGKSSSLRVAAGLCASSPLMRRAFVAASTLYFGLETGDKTIVERSSEVYVVLLAQLNCALGDPERGKTRDVLGTILLAIIYEVRKTHSGPSKSQGVEPMRSSTLR